MNTIKFEMSIDLDNAKHVKAMQDFLAALSPSLEEATRSHGNLSGLKEGDAESVSFNHPTLGHVVLPATAQKIEPKAEPKAEPIDAAVDLAYLRKLAQEKAPVGQIEIRESLKAKLTELGAENLTKLDESKFDEFHAFLLTL